VAIPCSNHKAKRPKLHEPVSRNQSPGWCCHASYRADRVPSAYAPRFSFKGEYSLRVFLSGVSLLDSLSLPVVPERNPPISLRLVTLVISRADSSSNSYHGSSSSCQPACPHRSQSPYALGHRYLAPPIAPWLKVVSPVANRSTAQHFSAYLRVLVEMPPSRACLR